VRRISGEEIDESGKRSADTSVVCDSTVLQRDVQIGANENALASDVGVTNRARPMHLGEELADQVDEPARVAPLVVVPAEDLHRPPVHHRQLAVVDT